MRFVCALYSRYTWAVILRHYLVWKNLLWSSLASNVFNPILFLFAFGFGLGAFIDTMSGVGYLNFIVPGMMAYAAMFAASFESTIGSFSRYWMQRSWDAVLASPVSLLELLAGEMLWSALKATFSALCVLVVGYAWGGIVSIEGALLAVPLVFLASLGFAAYGLFATAYAQGYEFFSYFFTFWVTPMFVFCGVFFDIARFPDFVQVFTWLFPMTHLIAVIRPLMLETSMPALAVAEHLLYNLVLTALAFGLAYRQLRRRMFD